MKRALVTGGSSGIGAALCKALGGAGWDVLVGYGQGQDRATGIARQINENNGHAAILQIPLQEPESISLKMEELSKQIESLDALVLCASPAPRLASFLKTDIFSFSDQFQVNVLGNHRLIAEVWKRWFRKAGGGHLVAILSAAAGSPPWPHMSSYVFGKRGLLSLIESAVAELGSSGLRATVMNPDYTETPMLLNIEPRILEAAKTKRPEGKFLKPEELANEILECLGHPPEAGKLSVKNRLIERAIS
jgi:3-oxoacyl-[acyl-carrier protein] reductase